MRTKELLIASAGALLLLGSCDVKDPIYNSAHPAPDRQESSAHRRQL